MKAKPGNPLRLFTFLKVGGHFLGRFSIQVSMDILIGDHFFNYVVFSNPLASSVRLTRGKEFGRTILLTAYANTLSFNAYPIARCKPP